jgi:hypothetical protein
MSLIGEKREAIPPRREVSWERCKFPSPDQLWLASFHNPHEWRMGAVGWQVSLVSVSDGTAIYDTALKRLSEGSGVRCPVNYAPWRADSMMLALLTWDEGLVLFDIGAMSKCRCGLDESPTSAQWAPHGNRLLVSFRDRLTLLDGVGSFVANADWKSAEHELPHTGWLGSGEVFFAIGRTSKRAKPRIGFFKAGDGSVVGKQLLDPKELVPYEAEKYKSVPRDRYSLIVSPSTRAVGSLLDVWSEVVYDQERGLLFLSTYRPVSGIFELDGHPACEVEEEWVSVEMSG